VGDEASALIPSLENGQLTLRVSDKSLSANPLGHTYKVYASIVSGNVKNLLPDMVAKVHMKLNVLGGIVVPSSCVQTMPEGTVVWVLKNGRAEHRWIEVGDFVPGGVVVKNGLASGDTVVVAGQQKLYTGAKVKTR
jgi:multidrug efflux pump subunit AcrA (membrane-fusion protein)